MIQSIDLSTQYAGVTLKNPLIIGACGKTKDSKSIVEMTQAGAAAVVMKTLFYNPVRPEKLKKEFELCKSGIAGYRAYTIYSYEPGEHNLDSYTKEIQRTVKITDIPVIASICCQEPSIWRECATQCMEAGAAMIELNVSCPVPHGGYMAITDIQILRTIISAVRDSVKVPIAVKLSPQVASPTDMATAAELSGANAVVLLNKFAGLEVDLVNEAPILHRGFSAITGPWFGHIVRRWVANTCVNIQIDVCGTGGVCSGGDVIKYLLCGAKCVEIAGLTYRKSPQVVQELLQEIQDWMELKGYSDIASFRGKVLKSTLLK